MASFTKLEAGGWRAQVRRKGISDSQNFRMKADAQAWAAKREHDILTGVGGALSKHTVKELFEEYLKRVSKGKAGEKWESLRIDAFIRDYPKLAARPASAVTTNEWAEWRDTRSVKVMSSTVNREMNLYSAAFGVARDEWKWIRVSPLTGVKRPKEGPGRDRRVPSTEMEAMQIALGYSQHNAPDTASARVGAAFEFAIETAMRSGEICALVPMHVHLADRFVHIPKSKNGDARNVGLTTRAVEILEQMETVTVPRNGTVFGLKPDNRDALFRKARGKAFDNLHFHDSRHEAITRLAQRLQILDLARMVGTRDLKTLMTYYNMHARDIAKLLG